MTTATTSAPALPDRIREEPHWRVAIRPARYEKERIATLNDCWRIVERTRVTYLGREYPFVAPEGTTGQPIPVLVEGSYVGDFYMGAREQGNDWIASRHDTMKEYWRLGQSGQFVHLFPFWEDKPDDWAWITEGAYTNWYEKPPDAQTRYLSFRGTIYRFTEIFEFAKGLMVARALDEAPVVRIEMRQITNRYLAFNDYWLGGLNPPRHKALEDLGKDKDWRLTLTDDPAQRAREAARWFFERFGYEASETFVKLAQDDFLNNRSR